MFGLLVMWIFVLGNVVLRVVWVGLFRVYSFVGGCRLSLIVVFICEGEVKRVVWGGYVLMFFDEFFVMIV